MTRIVRYAVLAIGSVLAGCATVPPSGERDQPAGPVGFFIIGDTGVIGDDGNLAQTAGLVREKCAVAPVSCDFGLMSGDNIYPNGATGDPALDGPTFDTLFTKPFGSIWKNTSPDDPRLFVALGNHDWYNGRAGAEAQVRFHESTRPFYMDGFFYTRRIERRGMSIDLFVIDSEMLLSPHTLTDFDVTPDGSMADTGKTESGGTPKALPVTDTERAQAAWFAKALSQSTADWKFVLAHHPIWQGRGDSKFAQSRKLRELILPALCRDADAYFAGHQHTIEVHTDACVGVAGAAPLPQIVSGAGAKAREINPAFMAWQGKLYPQVRTLFAKGDAAGFVEAMIDNRTLTVTPVTAAAGGPATRHPAITFRKRTRK